MARPSKLTSEAHHKIVEAIAAGSFLQPAAEYGGVCYRTLNEWMRRGEREKEGQYFQFLKDVHRAIAASEINLVSTIKKASQNDWRAAGWLLSRRYPERWSENNRVKVEVEKQLSDALDRLQGELPPHLFERVIEIIAEKTDFSDIPPAMSDD